MDNPDNNFDSSPQANDESVHPEAGLLSVPMDSSEEYQILDGQRRFYCAGLLDISLSQLLDQGSSENV